MKDWYLRQSPRDRLIVVVVGCLSVVGLLYALVWYPVESRIDRTERAIAAKRDTVQFLRQGAAQIRASGGVATPVQRSDKAPYLLIDEVIRRAGMDQPERLEPDGNDGARVQFSEVVFDNLVLMLAELETLGLQVTTMNITGRERSDGTVSARINMERG